MKYFTALLIVLPLMAQLPVSVTGGGGGGSFIAGTGITCVGATCSADPSVVAFNAALQAGTANKCAPASGSTSAYTCAMNPTLTTYGTGGGWINFVPDLTCAASPCTLNIDTLGAKNIYEADGTTTATLTASLWYRLTYNGTAWVKAQGSAAASAPTGRGYIVWPPGGFADMSATLTMAANRVYLFEHYVPVGVTISKATAKVATAQASSTGYLGIYDATCTTKLFEVSFATTGTGAVTGTTTGVSIPAGWYYLALGDDTASTAFNGLNGGAGTAIFNTGTNAQIGYGANTISAGHLPSACGAITGSIGTLTEMIFHN